MDETQEPHSLTPEQRQRASAVVVAGDVLRGRGPGKPLAAGSSEPADVADIVDLAEYIATGNVYSVKIAERSESPLVAILGQFGFNPMEGFPGQSDDKGSPEPDFPSFD